MMILVLMNPNLIKIKIRKMINNNKNYNIYTFNIPIIQYNYINYFT